MKLPQSREHSFPSHRPPALFEGEAVLHLSSTRWILLVFGCILPEISGAVIVFKISPVLSALLFAAALSTFAFIYTILRRQRCFVRVYTAEIELQTPRGSVSLQRKDILDCLVIQDKSVVLKHRDEIQVIELMDAQGFHSAFLKMSL